MRDAPRPDTCALVVVDVQNDFCHEDGAATRMGQDTSLVRAVVPNIEELVDLARATGVPRIFLRVVHDAWFDTPAWQARGRAGTTLDVDHVPIVEVGSWGAELYRLTPHPDELVLTKYRYSGFAYTPLELALRGRGVDTVVLAGTQTNVCVEATANDAISLGFHPVVVSDCVASGSDELHRAALTDFGERLGAVVTLEDLRRDWQPSANGRDSEGAPRRPTTQESVGEAATVIR